MVGTCSGSPGYTLGILSLRIRIMHGCHIVSLYTSKQAMILVTI